MFISQRADDVMQESHNGDSMRHTTAWSMAPYGAKVSYRFFGAALWYARRSSVMLRGSF